MDTQTNNVFCPICKSSSLSANQETFNNKHATIANAFLGAEKGILYGNMGPKKIVITCLSCGHVFKPGEGATEDDFDKKHKLAIQSQENIKSSRQTKKFFAFILLVVFIAIIWGAYNSLMN